VESFVMLQLHIKPTDSALPIEVEGITPCQLRSRTVAEIERLPILIGKSEVPLAELFSVRGSLDDETLEWNGADLSTVHWIAAQQTSGRTVVNGSAGRHAGSEMQGGTLEIKGNAGDWLGAELHGGVIRVRGNAADYVGSAYRGAAKGITGGTILVHGQAGHEIGHAMRRGFIAVAGNAGNFIGFHMLAGTVLIGGECGIRHGANMKRGTLIFLGPPPELLPTFQSACRYAPDMLKLLDAELQRLAFPLRKPLAGASWELFHGDFLAGGRGELYIRPEFN
jgi:formylmethanofuran dehydrogenase subunit C